MKKLSLVFMLVLFAFSAAMAQRTVKGTITDDAGEPLIGANVVVLGTTIGTVTDIDGTYELSVPEGSDKVIISYTGYATQELALGASNVLDVSLSEGVLLDAAIVTALGIEREKKSLGYAAQEVDGSELTKVKDVNFVNSLSGKVAGVDVKRSTTLGGSSNVIIRGYTSINGNNQALFVVNGVPINNDISNTTNQRTGRGGYDYGNAAMDINPEDVESVSVLRGAAATALYGSRAANGVILITTKKGSKSKNLGVTFSTGLTAGSIDKTTMPRYQKEYGAGYSTIQGWYGTDEGFDLYDIDGDGVEELAAAVYDDASFGPAFDSNIQVLDWRSWYPELDTYGQSFPHVAGENDATTFYETALTFNNSIAIDGGTDKGAFRLSYTNFDQAGIVPGSKIKRNTITFGSAYDVTEKLTASVDASFIKTDGKGRYGTGYDNRNVNQSFRQWYNTNVDMKQQEDVYNSTGKNISWNPYANLNPAISTQPHYFDNYYFNVMENFQTDTRNRMIGNVALKYQINDWLDVLGRVAMDRYDEIQEERIAVGSVDVPLYAQFNKDFSEMNYDLIFSANKYLGDDGKINLSGNLGTNIRRTNFYSSRQSTNGGLVVPNIYAFSNSVGAMEAPSERKYTIGVNGYFARASVGYDNFLYLDLAGRIDQSSTLPASDNTYPYGSASLSFIFSEFLESNVFSFGKARLNYAVVGNSAPAQIITNTFDLNTPFGGVALASAPNTQNNAALKPERTRSLEAGLEMNFWNNRLGLDISYYTARSFDQITPVAVTGATGSLFKYVNAGIIDNKGIELALTSSPVIKGDFRWTLGINFARNRNEVVELFDDLENIQLSTSQGGVSTNATVGQPYGTIWGTNYQYDANGEHIVYPHWNGGMRYRKTGAPEVIGDINPDWTGGILNGLSFKDITLSFLIDIQRGGDFFSLDTWYGYATGIYDYTAGTNDKGGEVRALPEEGGGLPIGGVVHATDADGNYVYDDDGNPVGGAANTDYGYASDVYSSFAYVYAPNALHVYDASFVKLREVSLTYALPTKLFTNSALSGINISLVGRNLWIIHKNTEYTDPEAGLSAGNVRGNQSGAYPAVKEIGMNLSVKF